MAGPITWQRLYVLGAVSIVQLSLGIYWIWGLRPVAILLLIGGSLDLLTHLIGSWQFHAHQKGGSK